MEPGVFARKLRYLNPKLKVYCGNDDSRPAGLYYVKAGEYTEVCSVDKQEVPKYIQFDSIGRITKGGWLRTIRLLVGKKLVNRREAEKSFKCNVFEENTKWVDPGDPIQNLQKKLEAENIYRTGKVGLTEDNIYELSELVKKEG